MELPAWRRRLGAATPWLYAILLVGIVVQVALAGAGLLAEPSLLATHASFVHVLELLALVLVPVAFLGGEKLAGWVAVALNLLIGVQYALIHAPGLARAGHVVNALVIFAAALLVLRERLPWARRAAA